MGKINIRKPAVIANGEIIIIELENMTCFLLGLAALEICHNRPVESIPAISIVRLRSFSIGMILPYRTVRKPQIRFASKRQTACFDTISESIIYTALQRRVLCIKPQPDSCRRTISIRCIHRRCAGDHIAFDFHLISRRYDLPIYGFHIHGNRSIRCPESRKAQGIILIHLDTAAFGLYAGATYIRCQTIGIPRQIDPPVDEYLRSPFFSVHQPRRIHGRRRQRAAAGIHILSIHMSLEVSCDMKICKPLSKGSQRIAPGRIDGCDIYISFDIHRLPFTGSFIHMNAFRAPFRPRLDGQRLLIQRNIDFIRIPLVDAIGIACICDQRQIPW